MTTKKEFIRKAMQLRPTAKDWRDYINKALKSGCLPSFNDMKGDYSDVYPLAGAIMERYVHWYLCGNSYESKNRKSRREANNIKCFI